MNSGDDMEYGNPHGISKAFMICWNTFPVKYHYQYSITQYLGIVLTKFYLWYLQLLVCKERSQPILLNGQLLLTNTSFSPPWVVQYNLFRGFERV